MPIIGPFINMIIAFFRTYLFQLMAFFGGFFVKSIVNVLGFAYFTVRSLFVWFFGKEVVDKAIMVMQVGTVAYGLSWAVTSTMKALGVSVVGYVGWAVLIPHVSEFISMALSKLPSEFLPVLQYLGVFDAVRFMFSVFFWITTIYAAKYVLKPPSTG